MLTNFESINLQKVAISEAISVLQNCKKSLYISFNKSALNFQEKSELQTCFNQVAYGLEYFLLRQRDVELEASRAQIELHFSY